MPEANALSVAVEMALRQRDDARRSLQDARSASQAEAIEDAPRQALVQPMLGLATPGIEAPADTGQPQLRVTDEARSGVAAPTVVHSQLDQLDIGSSPVV